MVNIFKATQSTELQLQKDCGCWLNNEKVTTSYLMLLVSIDFFTLSNDFLWCKDESFAVFGTKTLSMKIMLFYPNHMCQREIFVHKHI